MKCSECRGIGEVQFEEVQQHGRYAMQWIPCTECSGTGRDASYTERLQAALDAAMAESIAEMEAEALVASGTFIVAGKAVNAPGFTPEKLTAYVDRARAAQLRTSPSRTPGVVMVQSGSSPANYAVTRDRCGCKAGMTHGTCYHRALAIWLHDVEGVPVCTVSTIGFDEAGQPVARQAVA